MHDVYDHFLRPISVCIAAHDEERTIERTLTSILHQQFTWRIPMEILVCANACTDGTADVVRDVQQRYAVPIRLLEVDQKGKANAWNVLKDAADHDILVFADGDVVVDQRALHALYRFLRERPDLVLAAAVNAAVLEECDAVTRLTRPRATDGVYVRTDQDYVCGRLYGVRKRMLEAVMADSGYDRMPEHVLHEDAWLQRMLDVAASERRGLPIERVIRGEDRYWAVCREALVYFVPHSWREDPNIKARALRAEEQLRAFFPEYYAAYARVREAKGLSLRQRWRRWWHTLRRMSWPDRLRYVIVEVMKRRAYRKARRIVAREKRDTVEVTPPRWTRSETSRKKRHHGVGT